MNSKNELLNDKQSIILGDDCSLDIGRQLLVKAGLSCALSRIEFRLLHRLAMQLGRIVYIDELISYAWMISSSYVDRHELHVFMNRLRRKLGDGSKCLSCVRNVGYVLSPYKKLS